MTTARVDLWGTTIGAVSMNTSDQAASFEYAPDFLESGIQLSPFVMPLSRKVYRFPDLPAGTFHGLPGMLADSLPDRFGNALIDAWLARQGREKSTFNAVERLCYIGSRGMGALEFYPEQGPGSGKSHRLEVDELVRLASNILSRREGFHADISKGREEAALVDIFRVGTSAGGARAKAVIAWNPKTNEVRSGQVAAEKGFEHWLLKFDGVSGNKDKEQEDPKGFGAIEYAYHLMAKDAGIEMAECRLLEENGRRHFMSRRFDRSAQGDKLHMQSLGAMRHFDLNSAGAHSYEEVLMTIKELGMGTDVLRQMYRRMVFNIVGRNQDDHVKNIAFLMDRGGRWSLAPAFDVMYSYNPNGVWTATHQMTVNGKRDGFGLDDLEAVGKAALLKRGEAKSIVQEITEVVSRWQDYAKSADVSGEWTETIGKMHRLMI